MSQKAGEDWSIADLLTSSQQRNYSASHMYCKTKYLPLVEVYM